MILGSIVSKSMKYYHRRIVTTRKLNCLLSDRPTSFSLFGIHWDQNRRSQSMLTAQPRLFHWLSRELTPYGGSITVRLAYSSPGLYSTKQVKPCYFPLH